MNNSIFDKQCFFELEFSRFVISCLVLVAKILKDLLCDAFLPAELSYQENINDRNLKHFSGKHFEFIMIPDKTTADFILCCVKAKQRLVRGFNMGIKN